MPCSHVYCIIVTWKKHSLKVRPLHPGKRKPLDRSSSKAPILPAVWNFYTCYGPILLSGGIWFEGPPKRSTPGNKIITSLTFFSHPGFFKGDAHLTSNSPSENTGHSMNLNRKSPPSVFCEKRWLQVDQRDLRFACKWWKMVTNSSHGTIPIRKKSTTHKKNKSKWQEIQHGALPHIGLTFKIPTCDVSKTESVGSINPVVCALISLSWCVQVFRGCGFFMSEKFILKKNERTIVSLSFFLVFVAPCFPDPKRPNRTTAAPWRGPLSFPW